MPGADSVTRMTEPLTRSQGRTHTRQSRLTDAPRMVTTLPICHPAPSAPAAFGRLPDLAVRAGHSRVWTQAQSIQRATLDSVSSTPGNSAIRSRTESNLGEAITLDERDHSGVPSRRIRPDDAVAFPDRARAALRAGILGVDEHVAPNSRHGISIGRPSSTAPM
jgi:hypothetical protein